VRECLLSFSAESFVFQFSIQKFKDYDIQNYNIACCFNAYTVHVSLFLLHPINGQLCITTVSLYVIYNCALVGCKKLYCLLCMGVKLGHSH